MKMVALPWRRAMRARDPQEPHRVSTPLELFFDLTFVVAVAANAAGLHHDLARGDLHGLLNYALVFFAIWWAWVSYTWFASAYDSNDVIFRLMTFIIMAGVLVLAAGVPRAEAGTDYRVIVVGYLIMRLAMVPLWLRVAHDDPPRRRGALFYALAIVLVQLLWVAWVLWVPRGTAKLMAFGLLALLEVYLPIYAQRYGQTPWHPHHMAERYEAFTIIVLGEVLLATTQGITAVLDNHGLTPELVMLIIGGFLIVLNVWWLYFKTSLGSGLNAASRDVFNVLHLVIFAAVAALGASLGTLVDVVQGEAHLSAITASQVLACVLAVYLLSLTFIHGWMGLPLNRVLNGLLLAVLLLVVASLGLAPGLTTLLLGLLLSAGVIHHQFISTPMQTA